jgi:hypothetical protein
MLERLPALFAPLTARESALPTGCAHIRRERKPLLWVGGVVSGPVRLRVRVKLSRRPIWRIQLGAPEESYELVNAARIGKLDLPVLFGTSRGQAEHACQPPDRVLHQHVFILGISSPEHVLTMLLS